MKKLILAACFLSASVSAIELRDDITSQLPVLDSVKVQGFKKIENVAQYKNADWSQVVGIARNITISDALRIAEDNPNITFFFYTKGYQMILEKENGDYRVFRHGDTVFFTGQPWWGSAPGLADGYIKECQY